MPVVRVMPLNQILMTPGPIPVRAMDEDNFDRLARAVHERLRRQQVGALIDAQAILQDLSASFLRCRSMRSAR